VIGGDVDGVGGGVVADSQSQVSDAAGTILLHQDVLRLQVTVGDGWFTWGERVGEKWKRKIAIQRKEKLSAE
jgi:hypothetical protein